MASPNDRVSAKIKILRAEKVPQRQAVAEALSMERSHRIRDDGSYIRASKRKSGSRTGRR